MIKDIKQILEVGALRQRSATQRVQGATGALQQAMHVLDEKQTAVAAFDDAYPERRRDLSNNFANVLHSHADMGDLRAKVAELGSERANLCAAVLSAEADVAQAEQIKAQTEADLKRIIAQNIKREALLKDLQSADARTREFKSEQAS